MFTVSSNLVVSNDCIFLYKSQENLLELLSDIMPVSANTPLVLNNDDFLVLEKVFKDNLRALHGVKVDLAATSINALYGFESLSMKRKTKIILGFWNEKFTSQIITIEPERYFLVTDKEIGTVRVTDKNNINYDFNFEMFNVLFEENIGWVTGNYLGVSK
jgi:hypothetical protein